MQQAGVHLHMYSPKYAIRIVGRQWAVASPHHQADAASAWALTFCSTWQTALLATALAYRYASSNFICNYRLFNSKFDNKVLSRSRPRNFREEEWLPFARSHPGQQAPQVLVGVGHAWCHGGGVFSQGVAPAAP